MKFRFMPLTMMMLKMLGPYHVVHRHAAIRTLKPNVGDLGYAVVRAVPCFEEEHGRPVVGKVLAELAGGAGGFLGNIAILGSHGNVEGILVACQLSTAPSFAKASSFF